MLVRSEPVRQHPAHHAAERRRSAEGQREGDRRLFQVEAEATDEKRDQEQVEPKAHQRDDTAAKGETDKGTRLAHPTQHDTERRRRIIRIEPHRLLDRQPQQKRQRQPRRAHH